MRILESRTNWLENVFIFPVKWRHYKPEFSPENGGNANFVENEYDVRNARERRSKSNELLQ